jgi:putative membrane protein
MRLTLPSCFLAAATLFTFSTLPAAAAETATKSAPAKQLSSGDKKFVKDAAESQLEILDRTNLTSRDESPGSPGLKVLTKALATDLTTAWGELGGIAQARGGTMPDTAKSGATKRDLEALQKADAAKFDKLFLKALVKDTKKLSSVVESGAKSVQDPELKGWAAKWAPGFKTHHEAIDKAESEESKKK